MVSCRENWELIQTGIWPAYKPQWASLLVMLFNVPLRQYNIQYALALSWMDTFMLLNLIRLCKILVASTCYLWLSRCKQQKYSVYVSVLHQESTLAYTWMWLSSLLCKCTSPFKWIRRAMTVKINCVFIIMVALVFLWDLLNRRNSPVVSWFWPIIWIASSRNCHAQRQFP